MQPELIEERIRKEAKNMKLGEALSAYGYEKVEFEILCSVFGVMCKEHPRLVRAIIRDDLDFFLAPVDEPEK